MQVSSDTFYLGSNLPIGNQHVLARTINDDWAEYAIIFQAGKTAANHDDRVNVYDKNSHKIFIRRKLSKNGRRLNLKKFWLSTLIECLKSLKKMKRLLWKGMQRGSIIFL